MGANYSIPFRPDGTNVDSSIYMGDHNIHIAQTPKTYDDHSADLTEFRAQTTPGDAGAESLPSSLAGEIERLRYKIASLTGEQYWGDSTQQNALQQNNIIWNPTGTIAQAGSSFAGITGLAQKIFDGWTVVAVGNDIYTVSLDSVVKPSTRNFVANSIKMLATTGDSSVSAPDVAFLQFIVEGYDLRLFLGQYITISFWVFADTTGTYGLALRSGAADASYVTTFTVNSTATWEFKEVTIRVNPSIGTFNASNDIGLYINFTFKSGSTFQTSSTGAWISGNFLTQTGSTNAFSTNGNRVYLGAPKVSIGRWATQFLEPPYEWSLQKALRYYEKSYNIATDPGTVTSIGSELYFQSATTPSFAQHIEKISYKVNKRFTPTVTAYSPITGASGKSRDFVSGADVTPVIENVGEHGFWWNVTPVAPGNISLGTHWVADARL